LDLHHRAVQCRIFPVSIVSEEVNAAVLGVWSVIRKSNYGGRNTFCLVART
jgi:hypothetical protein